MRLLLLAVLGFFGFMFLRRRAGVPVPTTAESFSRQVELQELSFSANNNTLNADQKDRFLFLLSAEFGVQSAEVDRFRKLFQMPPVAPAPQVADPIGLIGIQNPLLVGAVNGTFDPESGPKPEPTKTVQNGIRAD